MNDTAKTNDPGKVAAVIKAILAVSTEVTEAMAKHAPMNSAHEAYAVILEELDEAWDEIKKRRENRSRGRLRMELTQIAAMAVRALVDLNLVGGSDEDLDDIPF